MIRPNSKRSAARCGLVFGLLVVMAGPLLPQAGSQREGERLRVEYTVEVKDTAASLFHVTATFRNLNQPALDLSLPVWTPGWYTIENYARNVLRFVVKDSSGSRLATPRKRPQTW